MNPISVLTTEIGYGFRESKWLPLFAAFTIMASVIGPISNVPYLYIPFCLIIFFKALKQCKFEIFPFLFLLYLPLNICVANPDPIFKSWMRFGLFVVVLLVAAPLLSGEIISELRRKMLVGILTICTILGLGSFVCYFIGVNYMKSNATDYLMSVGSFGGLTNHSITLGIVSGLGVIYLLYRANSQSRSKRIWYYILIICLLMTMLIAASRAALLATIVGSLAFIYIINKNKQGRFVKALMGISLIAILSFPLWEPYTYGINAKQQGNEQSEYGSRTWKWNARIDEIKSSPIVGVGFAAQSLKVKDTFNPTTGGVEPGSSWLAILSMTGIIGFLLFLGMIVKPFLYLKSHPSPYNAMLMALLLYICTNMVAEGYILAGGSALCFTAWLIIGCCNDARYSEP